jgi:hypothetical protein
VRASSFNNTIRDVDTAESFARDDWRSGALLRQAAVPACASKTARLLRERARRGSSATMLASLMDNKVISPVISGLFRSRNKRPVLTAMSLRDEDAHAFDLRLADRTEWLHSRYGIALSQLARVDVDARFGDESGKRMMRESRWFRPGTEAQPQNGRSQLARVDVDARFCDEPLAAKGCPVDGQNALPAGRRTPAALWCAAHSHRRVDSRCAVPKKGALAVASRTTILPPL